MNNIEITAIISLLYLPKKNKPLSSCPLDNAIRIVLCYFSFNFVIMGLVENFHMQTFFKNEE